MFHNEIVAGAILLMEATACEEKKKKKGKIENKLLPLLSE